MAIYLDANVLWSWRTFTEADRLALSIVAHQLGQSVFVPSIALREAEERYRRDLEATVERFEQAQGDVERRFSEQEVSVSCDPRPDIDDTIQTWRRRLDELAVILPLHDDDAHAAFDREITGTPPAKPREQGKPGRGNLAHDCPSPPCRFGGWASPFERPRLRRRRWSTPTATCGH